MQFFKNKRTQAWMTLTLLSAILILLNIIANAFTFHLDLTEEKRFTITEPTKKLVGALNDVVFINVMLEGKFPADFKRLQAATRNLLDEYHALNPYVEYKFEDPSVGGTDEERKKRYTEFAKEGLVPMRLRLVNDNEKTEQYIFPYAVVHYRNRQVIVKLLENEVPGQNPVVTLNNSIALLEYKMSNAIQKLLTNSKPNIVFSEGHGELTKEETADLEGTLRAFYDTGRLNTDSLSYIPFKDSFNRVDILVVAKPRTAFKEKELFLIDQYLMQGGKVIWLIDKTNADLAGLQASGRMLPADYPLNIDELLFKYGVRINPNIVADLECARIPLKTGMVGGAPQMDMFQWYYFPIVAPSSTHPVVKSLDRVWMQFPAQIDTIRTRTDVKKTVLLRSSKNSRIQFNTNEINFEILRYKPELDKFQPGLFPLAVLLEGQFPSFFDNRMSPEQTAVWQQMGQQFLSSSKPTKMLVVSDGDVARNDYDFKQNAILPLGYNRFENYKFANKDFLLNAIEYMLDDKGIIEARGKEVKLRLLDTAAAKENALTWRLVNIALPLVLLAGFGGFFIWRRKRRFERA